MKSDDQNSYTKEEGKPSLREAPFPLRRYFNLFVLPGMLLVVFAIIYATTQTVRLAAVEILLQLASQKVTGIARGSRRQHQVPGRNCFPTARSRRRIWLI